MELEADKGSEAAYGRQSGLVRAEIPIADSRRGARFPGRPSMRISGCYLEAEAGTQAIAACVAQIGPGADQCATRRAAAKTAL